MDENLKIYVETLYELTELKARLAVLHDMVDHDKYFTENKIYAIFGWTQPNEKEED